MQDTLVRSLTPEDPTSHRENVLVSAVEQRESAISIICPLPPEPPCPPCCARSAQSWAPCAQQQLPLATGVNRGSVSMSALLSSPSHSPSVHRSSPNISTSISALQIGSPVQFFLDSINIQIKTIFGWFFLTYFHFMTDSRFIHMTTKDPVSSLMAE